MKVHCKLLVFFFCSRMGTFVSLFHLLSYSLFHWKKLRAKSLLKNWMLYTQIILSPVTNVNHGQKNKIKQNVASKKCKKINKNKKQRKKKTLVFHHSEISPVKMAITKKTGDKCWWGYGEKGALVRFQKLKVELHYDPTIPFLGMYLKEMKTLSQR